MNRRQFLSQGGKMTLGAGVAPLLPRLLTSSAFAQSSTSSYKAIVCLYLFGGNDGNNMLVPIDNHYDEYTPGRGSLALARSSLLPITATSDGRLFGVHPSLPRVTALYNEGNAAFLANCGPLNAPATKATLNEVTNASLNLYSHPGQTTEWQSAITMSNSTTGWGGRIADLLSTQALSGAAPTVISTAGWSLFGTGLQAQSVTTGLGGNTVGVLNALQTLGPVLKSMENGDPLNHLHDAISEQQAGFINQTNGLTAVFRAGSTIKTLFPSTSVGQQLQAVAQLINGRSASAATQQIFYCQDGNPYDFHATQLAFQASNLAEVDAAIGSFVDAMIEIGMFDQVTLFTMTDFARSKQVNSSQGSDHAWGNHHFMVGGAVKGTKIYGTFPSLVMGGADDAGSTGLWIPTTSGSQYAATLTRWLGVNATDTAKIFPELAGFPTPTLGFL